MNKEKIIVWMPRIMSVLFALFLAMFSLDVFEPEKSAQEIATGLLVHNAPVLFLAAVVALSWRRELVGGITFITAGIFYIFMVMAGSLKSGVEWYMASRFLIISGPAFLIGALYLLAWRQRKAKKIDRPSA